jgi:hypothetical protein
MILKCISKFLSKEKNNKLNYFNVFEYNKIENVKKHLNFSYKNIYTTLPITLYKHSFILVLAINTQYIYI